MGSLTAQVGTLKLPDPLWGKRSFYQPSRGAASKMPPSLTFLPWAFLLSSTPPTLPPIQRVSPRSIFLLDIGSRLVHKLDNRLSHVTDVVTRETGKWKDGFLF